MKKFQSLSKKDLEKVVMEKIWKSAMTMDFKKALIKKAPFVKSLKSVFIRFS